MNVTKDQIDAEVMLCRHAIGVSAAVVVALADDNERLQTLLLAEQQRIISEAVPKEMLADVVREIVDENPDAKCIQCGEVRPKTDNRHWETCAKHPARIAIAALANQVAKCRALLGPPWDRFVCDAAYDDKDVELKQPCDGPPELGNSCWEHRRRALLAELDGTP